MQNLPAAGKKKAPPAIATQTAAQFEEANQLLKLLAEATGGRAYFPSSTKEFDAAYAEIAQLVRHEYSLAFAPRPRDGVVHSIQVRVATAQNSAPNSSAASFRVDHRQAYLAPQPTKP